jgi:hypothetical protein
LSTEDKERYEGFILTKHSYGVSVSCRLMDKKTAHSPLSNNHATFHVNQQWYKVPMHVCRLASD